MAATKGAGPVVVSDGARMVDVLAGRLERQTSRPQLPKNQLPQRSFARDLAAALGPKLATAAAARRRRPALPEPSCEDALDAGSGAYSE